MTAALAWRPGKKGLQANHRPLVTASVTRSIDLDKAYEVACPDATRWDYLLATPARVAGAEVHPVRESEVKVVIAKKEWATERLRLDEPSLTVTAWHWLIPPNASCAMTRTTPAARRLSSRGVNFPVRILAAL